MKQFVPGTLVHYNEIARLMSKHGSKLTGNDAAINAHIGGQFFFSPHPPVFTTRDFLPILPWPAYSTR